MVDQKLMKILRCPVSGAPLVEDGDRLVSRCQRTRRSYPIQDGIPVMLIEESQELTAEDHREILSRLNVKPARKKES